MDSTSSAMLAAILLSLFGIVGLVSGFFWRMRGYYMPAKLRAFGIGLSTLGVWLVLNQTAQLREWGAIRNWPSVEGTVLSSRIAGERAIHPEIVYQFSVDGVTYTDSTSFDTPSFGGRNVKQDVAESITAKFSPGSSVTVHYDPAAPSHSLLRTSPDWSIYGKIGLGGALLGVGLFLIGSARISRR